MWKIVNQKLNDITDLITVQQSANTTSLDAQGFGIDRERKPQVNFTTLPSLIPTGIGSSAESWLACNELLTLQRVYYNVGDNRKLKLGESSL